MRCLLIVMLFAGCDTIIEVSGTFAGAATTSGETGRTTSEVRSDGTLAAETRRFSTAEPDVRLALRRVAPLQVEADLGIGCIVRLEHGEGMNTTSVAATVSPDQRCTLRVDGFPSAARIGGTAVVRDDGSLHVELDARATTGDRDRAGSTWGSWHYVFDGARVTP